MIAPGQKPYQNTQILFEINQCVADMLFAWPKSLFFGHPISINYQRQIKIDHLIDIFIENLEAGTFYQHSGRTSMS